MNAYSSENLAVNIRIHKQINEISDLGKTHGIKVILIKGAAMIELFPEYSFTRPMEDIDIVVFKKDYERFRLLLEDSGYIPVKDDPCAMIHPDKAAVVDISCGLWYMDENCLERSVIPLSDCGVESDCYILKPQELIKNIIIHSWLHGNGEYKWQRDVERLKSRFNIRIESLNLPSDSITEFIKKRNFRFGGHIIKFLILPFGKKINYVFKMFFPEWRFLKRRYNCRENFAGLALAYIFRWINLLFNSAIFFSNVIKSLFSGRFLRRA